MIQPDIQQHVANEVNDRLGRATKELHEKYARGQGGQDVSVDGPSGSAYREKEAKEMKAKKERKQRVQATKEVNDAREKVDGDEDEDEEDGDGDGDEDHDLRIIREQRLRQIKKQQNQKLENLAKGHGQFREILQDEFLKEVTGSFIVICHFYHRDFPRCEIMNHHLQILANKHIETKFIKIDAEKAPFFIDKVSYDIPI